MKTNNHHILPFFIPHKGCPHRCIFCDQTKISGAVAPTQGEIICAIASLPPEIQPELAFYGGSFTALSQGEQEYYLAPAQPGLAAGRLAGIRVSTRPDYITAEILEFLRSFGVNRVELGVQSLEDNVLSQAGRGHLAAASFQAAHLLRAAGFDWGIQLLPGLPGEQPQIALERAAALLAFRPATARLYPALVIQGTALARMYQQGMYTPLTLAQAVEICGELIALCEHYGVSVIRIGLQNTADLVWGESVLAGPFHPAFGELVKSDLLYQQARILLSRTSEQVLLVNRRDFSALIGQKRANVERLLELYPDLQIQVSEALAEGTLASGGSCLSRGEFMGEKVSRLPFVLP